MITPDYSAQLSDGRYVRPLTLFGLSSDTKPTDYIANGSVFIEMDSSTVYFFDAENSEWKEWGA